MKTDDWQPLLSTWSALLIERSETKPDSGPFCGLGGAGASESQLAAAERRLGRSLPPSYREFLKTTNGLRQPPMGGAARGGDFWPVEEIDWFTKRNLSWVNVYRNDPPDVEDQLYFVYGDEQDPVHFRFAYLEGALELTHDGDASVYLLNPFVVDENGEWEAWHFATWYPGATRYRSFAEMMLDHYESSVHDEIDGF
jgi:hypothetical protein